MKRYRLAVAAVSLFSLAARADTLAIDPVHSSVVFKIRHFDTANFYGRFDRVDGTITTDAAGISALHVRVDADSIDTNNKDRDAHLRGPDFFDTKLFPDITFVSKTIKKMDGSTFEVTGDMTLHGTTKSIVVTLDKTGGGQNVKGMPISGFETTITLKRSDYGVSAYIGKGIADEVTLTISLEAGNP